MLAELISIGTELTTGRNLDTNTQWLSQRLAELGIQVGWHTTIADDLAANIEAFQIASRRARLILSTGGLGPTQDDLTREALAKAAGLELVFDPASLVQIEAMFKQRGRTMPERNRVQAYFPAGATPLPNQRGTAPGVWMQLNQAHVGAMPGVPSEMHDMFAEQIVPRLRAQGYGGQVYIERKINCFGAGESQIEAQLGDLTRRGQEPEVGITASDATISLRIFVRASSRAEALQIAAPIEETIRARLGSLVFGVDDEDLQQVVVRLLGEHRKTLSVAESITAGLVAHRLGQVPGASAWFKGGVTTYQNDAKIQILGIPESLVEEHGVISAPVVEAMAERCKQMFGTDLALSTVGIGGPGGGMPDRPVGLVFAGLAWEGGVLSRMWNWLGTRAEVQSRTAKLALNLARLHLRHPGSLRGTA